MVFHVFNPLMCESAKNDFLKIKPSEDLMSSTSHALFFPTQNVESSISVMSPSASGQVNISPDGKPSANSQSTSDAQALALLIQDQLDAINNEIKLIQVPTVTNFATYTRAYELLIPPLQNASPSGLVNKKIRLFKMTAHILRIVRC